MKALCKEVERKELGRGKKDIQCIKKLKHGQFWSEQKGAESP